MLEKPEPYNFGHEDGLKVCSLFSFNNKYKQKQCFKHDLYSVLTCSRHWH